MVSVPKKVWAWSDDETVTRYLPLVRKIASKIARRIPGHIQIDDLIGSGVIGLLEAAERYDPSKQEFERFAEYRVRGAILDELRRGDLMARDARKESKRIELMIADLRRNLNREPEEEEIADRLKCSVDELRVLLSKISPIQILDFGEDDTPCLSVFLSPLEHAEGKDLKARLTRAIGNLRDRQKLILQLYYFEELTLKDIGVVLNVTESRVSQLLTETTLRLRSLMAVEKEEEDV